MNIAEATDWIASVRSDTQSFLARLAVPGQPGRYRPAATGLTATGAAASLGFSCFAAKIALTTGLWPALPAATRNGWIAFIQSFQTGAPPHAFQDPELPGQGNLVLAETKQAAATLCDLGAKPDRRYKDLPSDPEGLSHVLNGYDWSAPWAAGGLASGIVTLLSIQGDCRPGTPLHGTAVDFYEALADPVSGAYWRGDRPDHGMMVNGAMKVLTALDWLEHPIRFPERLIDTVLQQPPVAEGCHLVDAVYVLWQCRKYTGHRQEEVARYALSLLPSIRRHQREGGGFSYFPQRSQTHYYGIPITMGQLVGDIHGTILLCWAIAMIRELIDDAGPPWRIIRP